MSLRSDQTVANLSPKGHYKLNPISYPSYKARPSNLYETVMGNLHKPNTFMQQLVIEASVKKLPKVGHKVC